MYHTKIKMLIDDPAIIAELSNNVKGSYPPYVLKLSITTHTPIDENNEDRLQQTYREVMDMLRNKVLNFKKD